MKKTTTSEERLTRLHLLHCGLFSRAVLLPKALQAELTGQEVFLQEHSDRGLLHFLPAKEMAYPFWWLYSLSLGTFFVLLPLTRYMHIPTELFLIFMRNSGIRTGDKAGTFSEVEVYSCSSCGICIDTLSA